MAEISKLNITELDFDTIKNNLKDYFKSQTEFSDHDFEGSAISVMLDVLSYNTHYNAYYMNMLASEAFLESAQLRDSVVAKASMLGYTPRSARGAKANVVITVTPGDSPATITIDKNTQFTSTINGTSYVFCTSDSHTITPSDGAYVASGVELTQGIPVTFRYTANTANTKIHITKRKYRYRHIDSYHSTIRSRHKYISPHKSNRYNHSQLHIKCLLLVGRIGWSV